MEGSENAATRKSSKSLDQQLRSPALTAEYMLESMVEDLHANDKDGSGDISQKEFKKIIRCLRFWEILTTINHQ